MPLSLKFKEQLPPVVAEELDSLITQLHRYLGPALDADNEVVVAPVVAALFRTHAAQSITNNSATKLTFNRPPTFGDWTNNGWDSEVRDGRVSMLQPDSAGVLNVLLPPSSDPGYFSILAGVQWADNTAGTRRLSIYDRSAAAIIASQEGISGTGNLNHQHVGCVVKVDAQNLKGFQVEVYQDSGGALDAAIGSWVQIVRLGSIGF